MLHDKFILCECRLPPLSPLPLHSTLTYTVIYLSVLPTHTTYQDTHDTHKLSNIWLPKHRYVKSSTLVRLKTRIVRLGTPVSFSPKFQETRCPSPYDISTEKFAAAAAKFQPLAALRGDQTLPWPTCFLFPFPVPTRHQWMNKLIPAPLPSILTGKHIAGCYSESEMKYSLNGVRAQWIPN